MGPAVLLIVGLLMPSLALGVRPSDTDNQLAPTARPTDQLTAEVELKTAVKDREEAHRFFEESELSFKQHQAPDDSQRVESEKHLNEAYQKLVTSQEKYLVARYDAAEAIFDARSEGRDTPTTHRLAQLLATEEKKDNQQDGEAPKPSAPKNDTSSISEVDPDEIPTGEKPVDLAQHKKAERQAKADLIEARKAAKILKERAHRTFQEALKAPTQADRDRILAAAQARLDEASEALEQARAARARLRRARAAIRKAAQAHANLVVQQSDSLDRAVNAVSSQSRDLEAQISTMKDQLKQLKVTMGQTQNSIDNPISDNEKTQSEKALAEQKKQEAELEAKLKSTKIQEFDVKKEMTKRVRKARGVRKQASSAQSLLTFVHTLRAAKHDVRTARKEVNRAAAEAERLWRKADELGLAARAAQANQTVQAETAAEMARRVATEADNNVEHALKDLQRAQRNLQQVQDEHFQQLIDLAQEKVKHAAANLSRARGFRQRLKLSAQQFTDEARELDAQVESAAATAVVKRQEQVDAAKNEDGVSEAQQAAIKAERAAQALRDQADAANERATQARLRAEKAASFVDTAVRRSRAAQRSLARVKVDAAISHARALRKEANSLFALANKQYEISERLSEEAINAKPTQRKLLQLSAKRELDRAKKTTAQAVRASRSANFAEKILRRRLRKFLFEASLRSNKEIESAKRAVHRTETLAHYTGHRARILRSQSDKLVSIAKQLKDKADRASAKVIAEPDSAKAAALAKLAEIAKQRYQDFQQLRLESKNKAAALAEADAREAEKRAEQVAAVQTKTQIEGEQEVETALVRMTEHAVQVATAAGEEAKAAANQVAAKVQYVQDLYAKTAKTVQTRRERKLKMALVKHQRGVSLRLARHARRLAKQARTAAKYLRRALKFKAKILREALDYQLERSKRLKERATKSEAKAKLNEKAAAESEAKLNEQKAVVKDKQEALSQESEPAAKDTAQTALQAAQHQLELLEAEHKVLQDRANRSRKLANSWQERYRRSVAKHLETLRQIKEIKKHSAKIVYRLFSEANHARIAADKTIHQLEVLFGSPTHLIKTGNSKVDIELAKQAIGDPQSPLTVAITNKSFKKTRQELVQLRSEAAQLLKSAEAAAQNVTANLAVEADKEAKKEEASKVVQLAKKALNSTEHNLQELSALTRSFAEQVDRAALAVTQRLMRETKTATKRVDRRVSSLADKARDAAAKAQAAEAALQKAESEKTPDVKQVRKLRQAAVKAAQASRSAQKKLLLAAHASAQNVHGPARAKLHKVVSIARHSIESIAKETRGKARRYIVAAQKALRKARVALGVLKGGKDAQDKDKKKKKRKEKSRSGAGPEENEPEAPENF